MMTQSHLQPMTVFARTPSGLAAAKSQASELTRELHMLLTAVDGRTKLNAYISILGHLGDVRQMMQALVLAGYVQDAQESTRQVNLPHHANSEAANLAGGAQPAVYESATWDFSAPALADSNNKPQTNAGILPDFGMHNPQANTSSSAGPIGSNQQHNQFPDFVIFMSNFVTQHMPEQSVELILELEGLTSIEQIKENLSGYSAMIAGFGEPARHHLAELRRLLETTITKFS